MTDVLKCYALAYKPEDCIAHLQVLKNHERGDEIVSWVEAAEPHLWVRSKMVVPRLDISTSNSVEVQFNAIA